MKLNKKWKVFLIHHSHTDIGYTERQEKIAGYHVSFIRQAIDILNKEEDNKGFIWQCENYWQIENFYKYATEDEKKDFEKYVKLGKIGVSLNYLNMTELISSKVLNKKIKSATDYTKEIDFPVESAMTADINGYAWGYADALKNNGVNNLFCCLHTHHGMFPLFKKQMPFYWETTTGEKLLVWNGEHYHLGNELMLSPLAGTTYTIFDDYTKLIENSMVFNKDYDTTIKEEKEIFQHRIQNYLNNLEAEGYPYDFIPIMVSGGITDNSPPNGAISQRVNWINETFADSLSVEMSTLDVFFDHLKANGGEIPTYKGDWPDWWADGVGSTSSIVKLFKDAQRKYHLITKLDDDGKFTNSKEMAEAEDNLMLYAEHTWGYSSSIQEPWETMVSELELKKHSYAITAHNILSKMLDELLSTKGSLPIECSNSYKYKVYNPHNNQAKTSAFIYIYPWEYIDGVHLKETTRIKVTNSKTGESIPFVLKNIIRAFEVEIFVDLPAGESLEVEISLDKTADTSTITNFAKIGADRIEDILDTTNRVDIGVVETDFFKLTLDENKGIVDIIDKKDGASLIREDYPHGLFSGIYEVTHSAPKMQREIRRLMGRNRKTTETNRYYSKLKGLKITEINSIYVGIELNYELEGTEIYCVQLKVYKVAPKISAKLILHKTSVWSPENLYIAAPLTVGEGEEKYIDKSGCFFRPAVDQLPGSNQDFYLTQTGVCLKNDNKTMLLNLQDTPLITLGSLNAKPIELFSSASTRNKDILHVWAMNNYWETNFKVDLAGFYEFRFELSLYENMTDNMTKNILKSLDQGLLSFRI